MLCSTTPPTGTDLKTLQRLCHDDPEALDLLDQAARGKPGGDRRSEEYQTKRDNITNDNINTQASNHTPDPGSIATVEPYKSQNNCGHLWEVVKVSTGGRWVAEIKLRAERKGGELLRDMEKNKGAQGIGPALRLQPATAIDAPPTLSDLGIEKTQSHRWQAIASIPEEAPPPDKQPKSSSGVGGGKAVRGRAGAATPRKDKPLSRNR